MKRRSFFGRFVAAVTGAAAATALPEVVAASVSVPPSPTAVQQSFLLWPCMTCEEDNRTELLVWPSVKFRLTCMHCGRLQSYALHLIKFDPNPTLPAADNEFQRSPLKHLGRPQPSLPMTPRRAARIERDASHYNEIRKVAIRQRLNRTRFVLPLPD